MICEASAGWTAYFRQYCLDSTGLKKSGLGLGRNISGFIVRPIEDVEG